MEGMREDRGRKGRVIRGGKGREGMNRGREEKGEGDEPPLPVEISGYATVFAFRSATEHFCELGIFVKSIIYLYDFYQFTFFYNLLHT